MTGVVVITHRPHTCEDSIIFVLVLVNYSVEPHCRGGIRVGGFTFAVSSELTNRGSPILDPKSR